MGQAKRLQGIASRGEDKLRGENFYHGKRIVNLNRMRKGRAIRNKAGKIIKAAPFQSDKADPVVRVEPHRKWFTPTRKIGQRELELFRWNMEKQVDNPYKVVVNRRKLPTSLLTDKSNPAIGADGTTANIGKHLLERESFSHAYSRRKKPRLEHSSLEDLAKRAADVSEDYQTRAAGMINAYGAGAKTILQEEAAKRVSSDPVLSKGLSKRIWNELYKVVDSSDVVIHVLDVRDPIGTRCLHIEKFIKEKCPHKHMVYLLNKCDLVPPWVIDLWLKRLSKEKPTVAFQASMERPFGKGALIQLLRRFAFLHKDKKQISCGIVGYPNTGKSSIINTLRRRAVCKVAPIPGETKVWQYVNLTKRIYLVDCPGVCYPGDDPESVVRKGVVRAEALEDPVVYIPAILKRIKPEVLERHYEIEQQEPGLWADDVETFLEALGRRFGRLNKGGSVDIKNLAQKVIRDYTRGHLPFFELPRKTSEDGEVKEEDIKKEDEAEGKSDDAKSAENKNTELGLPMSVAAIMAADQKAILTDTDYESDPQVEGESDSESEVLVDEAIVAKDKTKVRKSNVVSGFTVEDFHS